MKVSTQNLTAILRQAKNRVLDIVDDQVDFIYERAALPVPNAEEIVKPTNKFFADIPVGIFDFVLVKFDTHFADEYRRSPENTEIGFPPHCIYGTPGWQLAVDIAPLLEKMPVYGMIKNVFDMWGSNPTGVDVNEIVFTGNEKTAYDNLFRAVEIKDANKIQQAFEQPHAGQHRDDFMAEQKISSGTVITLIGVADDYCDLQALVGYLKRGATVIMPTDLMRGIGNEFSPAPDSTGRMKAVIANFCTKDYTGTPHEGAAAVVKQAVDEGRIVLTQSDDLLAAMVNIMKPDNIFTFFTRLGRKQNG